MKLDTIRLKPAPFSHQRTQRMKTNNGLVKVCQGHREWKGIMSSEIKLFNMDCMEAMKQMPDKAFDLAIVDPPYRDENQPTQDMRNNNMIKNFGKKPNSEYFEQLFRVSQEQIIWGANNFSLPNHKGFAIWRKLTIGEAFTMSMCEYAYISEGLGTTSKYFELHPQDKLKIHPTQKPVKLYQWLLNTYASPGDKILDTHLGSGSIAIACYDMGYDLAGFEIDKDYYEAACKRLENHKRQMTFI